MKLALVVLTLFLCIALVAAISRENKLSERRKGKGKKRPISGAGKGKGSGGKGKGSGGKGKGSGGKGPGGKGTGTGGKGPGGGPGGDGTGSVGGWKAVWILFGKLKTLLLELQASGHGSGLGPGRIIIGPGYYANPYLQKYTEILTSMRSTPSNASCPPVADFPIPMDGSFGTQINDHIVYCGGVFSPPPRNGVGLDNSGRRVNMTKCFAYCSRTRTWDSGIFPELPEPRANGASVWTKQGWWITGGLMEGNNMNSGNSVILQDQSTWIPGPPLPMHTYYHCLVHINSQKTLLVGDGWSKAEAHIYDWTNQTWTQIDSPQTLSHYFTCGKFKSGDIVAAAGLNEAFVEVLDVESLTWSSAPPPCEGCFIKKAKFVEDGGQLLLVGAGLPGERSDIFVFEGNGWSKATMWTMEGHNKYDAPIFKVAEKSLGCF